MDEDAIKEKFRRRREELQQKGLVPQLVLAAVGVVLVTAGLVMLVLPGPAFVFLPLGLALVSVRFAWAAKLLDMSIERTAAVSRISRRKKIVAIAVASVLGASAIATFFALQ